MTGIILANVQKDPVIANPIVQLDSSNHYTPNSEIMFKTVSFIIIADVIGATLPGNDNAQTTLIPNFDAALKSTPPGFDAKSIIKASFFTSFKSFSSNINAGTVLKITSNSFI